MRNIVLLFALIAVALAADRCAVTNPIDCGYPGISKDLCETRGCCYVDGASPSCFYPESGQVNITKVHIVHGCHFDAGFVDDLYIIINRYFDTFFPAIHDEGMRRKAEGDYPMKFTSHSYLIYLFFNCPANSKLHCPDEKALEMMKESIENEFITWHSFPHVPEYEVMDKSLIQFGIQMSNDLKRRFNKPDSIILNDNDVPGQTAGLIPIMLENNIRVFRAGVNPASQPPNTPPIYIWKDPATKKEVIGVTHRGGYGGEELRDLVVIPGYSEALLVSFNGDNAGPYDKNHINNLFKKVQSWFPEAEVQASTYEDFFLPFLKVFDDPVAGAAIKLPVLEREHGDTWVYGVASDPLKMARFRAYERARVACEEAGECTFDDQEYYSFSTLLTKNGEHTWGVDIKTYLNDRDNWLNPDFHKCLDEHKDNYEKTIRAWIEQRSYGFDMALEVLNENHPLRKYLKKEDEGLIPTLPDLAGFKEVDVQAPIETDSMIINVDPKTGAISRLLDKNTNREWCSEEHPILRTHYRTYTIPEYQDFFKAYLIEESWWSVLDFGKPGLENYWNKTIDSETIFKNLYVKEENGHTYVVIQNIFDPELVKDCGASEFVYTVLDIFKNTIQAKIVFKNKTATRLPETIHIDFNPLIDSEDKNGDGYYMNKLGQYYRPSELDPEARGNMHQHGIMKDIKYEYNGRKMSVETLDIPLATFGKPYGFPTPFEKPDLLTYGASFMCMNNLWGTNYIMWYPFVEEDKDQQYRFTITFN